MRRLHSLTALRAFEAVSRLKSISAAAEELRVTRPAVSKQVKQLEATLGVQLLVRSGNAIQLTAAGEELFDGLRRSFDLMSATLAAVGRFARESQRLKILVCRDFASSWLASRVGTFLVENPGVSIEVTAEKNGNLRLEEDFDLRIFYDTLGLQGDSGLRHDHGPHHRQRYAARSHQAVLSRPLRRIRAGRRKGRGFGGPLRRMR